MKIKNWSSKKLIVLVVLLAVCVAAWFVYYGYYLEKYANFGSSYILGQLKSISGDRITVSGSFIKGADLNMAQDYLNRQDVVVLIRPDTKFIKLVRHLPVSANYIARNQTIPESFKITEERVDGSVSDLANLLGIPITAKARVGILNKSIIASEIIYTVYTYTK